MTGPRVCIDGFNLSMPRGTGIASYARGLIPTIRAAGYEPQILFGPAQAMGASNLLNEIALFDAPRERSRSPLGAARARATRVTLSKEVMPPDHLRGLDVSVAWAVRDLFDAAHRRFGARRRLTEVDFAGQVELAHWTCPLPLDVRGARLVGTIHDLAPLRAPHATLDNKSAFHALIGALCRACDAIIVDSEATLDDLTRFFSGARTRAFVIQPAVDLPAAYLAKSEEEAAAEVAAALGVEPRRYFLFCGALEPKKNLGRLVEAYLRSGAADPLIVACRDGWLTPGQDGLLVAGSASERVRFYQNLPRSMIIDLIRGAKALLFPSLIEGFGLPAAEAMALGTPVLASTTPALQELSGGAAVHVDPYDVTAMKRAIQALDADEALRANLSEQGEARAIAFAPERAAERLAEVYRTLI